ncbi:MAG: S41 family peptidase [Balneolaceae bacterium]
MKRYLDVKIVLLLGLLALGSVAAVRSDIYFEIRKQLTIFSDVYKEIATLYVDEVSPQTLVNRGVEAMLESLDPYTVFIGEGEQQQMEILSSGNYGGIGIDAGHRRDQVVVVAPLEGYPAERSGILPGDIIVSVNGLSVRGMNPEEVQQLTIGDVGTEITLEIERSGIDEPLSFRLVRERIEVKNILYSDMIGANEDVAYIQLMRFGQNASGELREILHRFQSEGSVNGVILDLRNNPGGLLHEAVSIVDKFIEPGITVVETRGRVQEQSNVYVSEEPPMFEDVPLVVLLNNGSASASEVVAGAFQDLDRAVILGESSFGKGLVQTIRPLSYNTSLKMTVSRYYTPSGRSIQSVEYPHDSDNRERVIADSLHSEFATRNGRKVYDGMGIEPDIVVKDLPVSLMEVMLRQNNHYFFFVNDYVSGLENPVSGSMPEDLFERFMEYLEVQEFDYNTPADRRIQDLKSSSNLYTDSGRAHELLDELDRLVQEQKRASLEENRERIEKELHLEWLARTGSQEERIHSSIPSDRYIQQGLSLLSKRAIYDSILTP